MTAAFDRPPDARTRGGHNRLIGLDVTRAIALIGVVVMNYHGMTSYVASQERTDSLIDRVFDIQFGVLSTRFAAAFVVVAGIGVGLLTRNSLASGDRSQVLETRLRLLRRGVVLLIVGYFLDMAWPGTILFYYGVYFVLASFIFHLTSRSLVLLAAVNVVATMSVSIWSRSRLVDGDTMSWLSPSNIDSLQDLGVRTFVGYTHPVLPWMVFFIAGMLIARHWLHTRVRQAGTVLIVLIASTYLVASVVRMFDVDDEAILYVFTSMQPDERGLAYIVSTLGIATLAFFVISEFAQRHRSNPAVVTLQRAGQMSLTLYLGHVLFHYAIVEWLDWNFGSGLGSAISLALAYWALAILVGSWWHHRVGPGPAEWIYRRLGG